MKLLLDTSVLAAFAQPEHPKREAVGKMLAQRFIQGSQLCIATQCLFEFYVVGTRPLNVNGLGYTQDEVFKIMSLFKRIYTLLPDSGNLLSIWEELLQTYSVMGKPAHDARLVALMRTNQVEDIFTLNPKDFVRYEPEIKVLTV